MDCPARRSVVAVAQYPEFVLDVKFKSSKEDIVLFIRLLFLLSCAESIGTTSFCQNEFGIQPSA